MRCKVAKHSCYTQLLSRCFSSNCGQHSANLGQFLPSLARVRPRFTEFGASIWPHFWPNLERCPTRPKSARSGLRVTAEERLRALSAPGRSWPYGMGTGPASGAGVSPHLGTGPKASASPAARARRRWRGPRRGLLTRRCRGVGSGSRRGAAPKRRDGIALVMGRVWRNIGS